ncbi:MAG: pyridoxine 5'-phosphate synthase [Pseudomonadota bacterium]|nr:pyridoxine 5'-phosphate synthase [Pseudomonadota bacterium]|tara:strand:+ start:2310 stop:3038 length:729 start_codon:yes stop_codon:yes gene_type:complete
MLLGVNIDHIATLRQARGTQYPDIIHAASIVENAGADSITIHLREDRRHIQENDVRKLKESLKKPMNLEMALTNEMLMIAEEIKPAFCCFVPEKREELTTEGGLNVVSQLPKIKESCKRLGDTGIRVSLFIDADEKQINAAAECLAPYIEIHTGHYADANNQRAAEKELDNIRKSITLAIKLGLKVNAGHGLNYENIGNIAVMPEILELNIGHSIISRAVFIGLSDAVQEMKRLINNSASSI